MKHLLLRDDRMGVLILKLAGPLQSWGAESRFTERTTRHEPTKSGIVGLLAAALGRKRTESVDDLAELTYAVRVDQPGKYVRDFHTAHKRAWNKEIGSYEMMPSESMPLSHRYYLSDAVFVVAVQVEGGLFEELQQALEHPSFPLFLGRRSCPPSCKVLFDVVEDDDLMEALRNVPWQASERYRRTQKTETDTVTLEVMRDVLNEDETGEVVRDVPLSFSQERRDYAWRTVVHDRVQVPRSDVKKVPQHDPWAVFKEV